jgi:IclR family acetate operon transcriptional repressor
MSVPELPTPAYPIESVAHVLELLLLFRTGRAVRVAEAGRTLGVARSTAHRLLAMLAHYGFVVQDARTRAYRAGTVLAEMSSPVAVVDDIQSAARSPMEALASRFDETVHLCTLRGRDVVYLSSIESSKALRAGNRAGTVLPAHATAAGKAMLAALGDEALLARFPREALPTITSRTISTRTELIRALRTVRKRGFAINNAESERGLTALSCAVFSRTGELRGAIALSGPDGRFRSVARQAMAAALRAACEAVSATIR